MKIQIIDNDGFLAIANVSKYESYVTEDWELDELFNHFLEQMKTNSFLVWRTGWEGGTWNVEFVTKESTKEAFREFSATVEVTDEKLYLTEYADLTMAASYEDEQIPSSHNSELFIKLENGMYSVKVRQLFNPDIDEEDIEEKLNFEIVISQSNEDNITQNDFNKIQWYQG